LKEVMEELVLQMVELEELAIQQVEVELVR
jgi:hypothetical protein